MTRRADWLLSQLPMGMLDDDFFVRFVSLFQHVATSLLEGADNVTNVVDVTVAPPELVRYLGSWIGTTSIDPSLQEELQRLLVRQASRTLAWRGTRQGLGGFLEVLTGAPAEISESGAVVRDPLPAREDDAAPEGYPRWVDIHVDSVGFLSEADFVELVTDEIPANVAWTLFVGDRQIHPAVAAAVGAGGEEDGA